MIPSAAEELTHLVRSGWRLISLETFEEDRALLLIDRVATSCERACIPWSIGSGLGAVGKTLEELDRPGVGSLGAGLEAMAQVEEPALFVILDAHRVLDDPVAVRAAKPPSCSRRSSSCPSS